LELDKTSYVDEELKESFSDLVYNCKYNQKTKIKISILIEHKSYAPDYPHIQLLKYLLKIWESNIKQKQNLIPVIPLIFYHGKEKWKLRSFYDSFIGIDREIEPFLPSFKYLLTDLSLFSDTEIENLYNAITVQISLLLMKRIFDEDKIKRDLFTIFSGLEQIVETERGEKFLISIFSYIYHNTEIKSGELNRAITKISNLGGQIAMTTATKLRQEGMLQGENAKALEIAKKMLKNRMLINDICKLTGLSIERIEQLRDMNKKG